MHRWPSQIQPPRVALSPDPPTSGLDLASLCAGRAQGRGIRHRRGRGMHRQPLRVPAKLELHGEDGEEREVHAPCAGYG
jgi:hypothetical protein